MGNCRLCGHPIAKTDTVIYVGVDEVHYRCARRNIERQLHRERPIETSP